MMLSLTVHGALRQNRVQLHQTTISGRLESRAVVRRALGAPRKLAGLIALQPAPHECHECRHMTLELGALEQDEQDDWQCACMCRLYVCEASRGAHRAGRGALMRVPATQRPNPSSACRPAAAVARLRRPVAGAALRHAEAPAALFLGSSPQSWTITSNEVAPEAEPHASAACHSKDALFRLPAALSRLSTAHPTQCILTGISTGKFWHPFESTGHPTQWILTGISSKTDATFWHPFEVQQSESSRIRKDEVLVSTIQPKDHRQSGWLPGRPIRARGKTAEGHP